MTDLERAIVLAVEAHHGQVDKSEQPYILHPLRVMLSVACEEDRIPAVLHDVVEDSKTVGAGDILALFGEEVWSAVRDLTRTDDETYEEFISRAKSNPISRRVKIADIKDNLRPGCPEYLRQRYEKALVVLESRP